MWMMVTSSILTGKLNKLPISEQIYLLDLEQCEELILSFFIILLPLIYQYWIYYYYYTFVVL